MSARDRQEPQFENLEPRLLLSGSALLDPLAAPVYQWQSASVAPRALSGVNPRLSDYQRLDTALRQYYLQYRSASLAGGGGAFLRELDSSRDTVSPYRRKALRVYLNRHGVATANARINRRGETDVVAVVATRTGVLDVDVWTRGRGWLKPVVSVYDAQGRLLATGARSADGRRSGISVTAQKGQRFYVRVSGYYNGGQRCGKYRLRIRNSWDDAGNSFVSARRMPVSDGGDGMVVGHINYSDDVDMLVLTATRTGLMQVYMADIYGGLDAQLAIFDSDGVRIASDDDSGEGMDAQVTFDVTAGQMYFIRATAHSIGSGYYAMSVTTQVDDPVPEPEDPEPASPGAEVAGEVASTEDGTALRVLGTNASDVITLQQNGLSITLITGEGSETFIGAFDTLWIYGFGGDDTIRLTNTVTIASVIYAGDGDDNVFTACTATDWVYGGEGSDLLVSVGGGADHVTGDYGRDSFWADGDDLIRDVSSTETGARTVHVIESFYQPWTDDETFDDYVPLEIAGQDLRDPALYGWATGYVNYAPSPLFTDGPDFDDIDQGGVGDCYYLAALASLSDSDPDIISEMIAPMGDGTFAVRYFRDKQEHYVRIDADLPVNGNGQIIYARMSAEGEMWVPLVEKAYCFFRLERDDSRANSYEGIVAGWMHSVYAEVSDEDFGWQGTYVSQAELANYVRTHLQAGHAVSAGSNWNASGPVVSAHAYMIKSIDYLDRVTLYNVWGCDGGDRNDGCVTDGLVTLTISEVKQYFSTVVICTA